jgi:hypothetical protein
MTEHKMAVPVLASFPDVNDVVSVAPGHEAKGLGLLASGRRLVGQALSIKLLAGTALFLMVGAVLPFCIGNKAPADLPPIQDSLVTVEAKSRNTGAQASAVPDEAAALIASRPAVRVVPAKEPSYAPASLAHEIDSRPQAGPAADALQASQWPAKTGGELLPPDVNRPAPVRQAEYEEADARARLAPGSDRENRR